MIRLFSLILSFLFFLQCAVSLCAPGRPGLYTAKEIQTTGTVHSGWQTSSQN